MLNDYKKQLILRELRDAPDDFIDELYATLQTNKRFIEIYDNDFKTEAKRYFDAVNSEIIKFTALG